MDFCLLLGFIAVVSCDPQAQAYEPVLLQLPAVHVAQLASVEIWDKRRGGSAYRQGKIWLPAQTRQPRRITAHELAQVVMANPDSSLQLAFSDRFWPNGQPLPGASEHALETFNSEAWWQPGLPEEDANPMHAAAEDLADTYMQLFAPGQFDPERRAWLCSQDAHLAEAPGCQPWKLLYPDLRALPPTNLFFDTVERNGVILHVLRFTARVWNAGDGPLEVRGTSAGSLTEVFQRIYDDGGSFTEVPAGQFTFHEGHNHWHFEDFAEYQLWTAEAYDRWIASGRTLGEPGWSTTKTTGQGASFCIRDSRGVKRDLPGSPQARVYARCDREVQGISVGWADSYRSSLPDQWVEIGETALAPGQYVLRIVADPLNRLQESPGGLDETRESGPANEAITRFTARNGRIQ